MSAIGMGRVQRVVVVTAVACALASCGKDNPPPQQQSKVKPYEVPKELDRELNDSELDSLQQMKQTYRVTRDEYWDGYGGVLASDELEVWYPDGKLNSLQGMAMLKLAAQARARAQKVFGTVPPERVVIICTPDVDLYVAKTGRQWWHYSRIVGDTISIQPPISLHTRGLLTTVGPREYYEWVIIKLSKGRAPRWVQEGFASYLAREAPLLEDLRQDFGTVEMSTRDMDSALERESDRQATRRAYYNAYRTVEEVVKVHGQETMARFVLALGEDDDKDAASRSAFGQDYEHMVEAGRAWTRGAQ